MVFLAFILLPGHASAANCVWNGNLVVNGALITAWESTAVQFDQMCHSESRRCNNGTFDGIGYQHTSCSMLLPQNCTFNGTTIAHGATVRAYGASSPPAGASCTTIAEDRLCYNGNLSGTSTITTCNNTQNTPAPPPAECQLNGVTVPNGGTITAFGMVPDLIGGGLPTCEAQARICSKGVLSGTYTLPSCPSDLLDNPRACQEPDGLEIQHGRTSTYFRLAQAPPGQVCAQLSEQRVCSDGTLSGSFPYHDCTETPRACPFNGMLVPDGATVTAFLAATPSSGMNCKDISTPRSCIKGVLFGDSSYKYLGCSQTPIPCTFNGVQIPHTGSIVAYERPTPPEGEECKQQVRHCQAGVLDGSYNAPSCSEDPPPTQERPCTFNGVEVPHGQSAYAYRFNSVPDGDSCDGGGRSEDRWCWDGRLTGSFTYNQCVARLPTSGTNCNFAGRIIANGGTVTAYSEYEYSGTGGGCPSVSAALTCRNGELRKGDEPQGDFIYPSCRVVSCMYDGQALLPGTSLQRYWKASVPFGESCDSVTISCNTDGSMTLPNLMGNPPYDSSVAGLPENCVVGEPNDCTWPGETVKHGESVTAYQSTEAPAGEVCVSENRICENGTLSGNYTHSTCTVLPAPTPSPSPISSPTPSPESMSSLAPAPADNCTADCQPGYSCVSIPIDPFTSVDQCIEDPAAPEMSVMVLPLALGAAGVCARRARRKAMNNRPNMKTKGS